MRIVSPVIAMNEVGTHEVLGVTYLFTTDKVLAAGGLRGDSEGNFVDGYQ